MIYLFLLGWCILLAVLENGWEDDTREVSKWLVRLGLFIALAIGTFLW